MGKASLSWNAAILVALIMVSCASPFRAAAQTDADGGLLSTLFGKRDTSSRKPTLSSGKYQEPPTAAGGLKTAVTQNPVSRAFSSAFQRGAQLFAPRNEPAPPSDPTALSYEGHEPTAALHVAMARMQEKSGNHQSAAKHYALALKSEPHDLAALLGMGHLLDRQGKLEDATRSYQLAAKHHPKQASAHNDLALCYARRDMFEESIASLNRAVELHPDRKLYRNNLATVLVERGRLNEALAHLTRAHGPANANYNLGVLMHQRGRQREAIPYFAKAVEIEPTLADAHQWLDQFRPASPVQVQPTAPKMPTDVVVVEAPGSQSLNLANLQDPRLARRDANAQAQQPPQPTLQRLPGSVAGHRIARSPSDRPASADLRFPEPRTPENHNLEQAAPTPDSYPGHQLKSNIQPLPRQ